MSRIAQLQNAVRSPAQADSRTAAGGGGEHSRRRAGYSLLELILVVGIVAFVLGAVAVALQSMFRVDRQLRDDAADAIVLPRLAIQLRSDAHAAQAAEVRLDASLLVLTAPGRTIEYTSQGRRIVRRVRDGERQVHQEVYPLRRASGFEWQVRADAQTVVQLRILHATADGAAPDAGRAEQIDAVVGLHPTVSDTAGTGDRPPTE